DFIFPVLLKPNLTNRLIFSRGTFDRCETSSIESFGFFLNILRTELLSLKHVVHIVNGLLSFIDSPHNLQFRIMFPIPITPPVFSISLYTKKSTQTMHF